jgi:hypothetical protein
MVGLNLGALERELVWVARASGGLRVGLGFTLEALATRGGHHDLGFSSVGAYAMERCERSARWAQDSRALARRLKGLVAVRGAVLAGRIGFSMAQEIARVATPSDESAWLAEAEGCTVRELRRRIRERRNAAETGGKGGGHATCIGASHAEPALGTLTVTVNREDAWLFEGARMVVRNVAGASLEETIEALVGEGTTTLFATMDRERMPDTDDGTDASNGPQRAWEAQLSAWREEAEVLCEKRIPWEAMAADTTADSASAMGVGDSAGRASAMGVDESARRAWAMRADTTADSAWAIGVDESASVGEIDGELQRLAARLANRDVELGRFAETFWRADGWRRLGFATESQYVRERLGMSLSAVKAKRALSRRLAFMPQLADAVTNRQLGYEAARVVSMVATTETVDAWIARAQERTVKHLLEEVDAAQMLGRLHATTGLVPPAETTMARVADIECRVVNGQMSALHELGCVGRTWARDATDTSQANANADTTDAGKIHGVVRRGGRVALKFRVDTGLCRYYRWLEGAFRRNRAGTGSFFGFLCAAVIDTWARPRDGQRAYAHIYARDNYRCRSPVCRRRDVTPHHLTFRSRGGDDGDANVASLCTWCHLDGIHGGRLAARGPAEDMHWTIGRTGHTVVRGRRRQRAASLPGS